VVQPLRYRGRVQMMPTKKRTAKKPRAQRTSVGRVLLAPFRMFAALIGAVHRMSERNAKRMVAQKNRPRGKPRIDPLALVEAEKGSLGEFERVFERSTIGIILGARGTGKTALGLRILENIAHVRPVVAMGFERSSLPRWIEPIASIEAVPNGSCVLIDEGGVLFGSRSSMSEANKILSELILISRHKDLAIVFISQNSSNLEVNVLRQADYLLLKPASLLQLDFERKIIEKVYRSAKEGFEEHRRVEGLIYVYADAFRGFARNTIPSFWGEDLSKQFKRSR
jgi:hypothetical protein